MAAAVADFRPKSAATEKMKSRDGAPRLELEATDDVLKALANGSRPRVVVGFAAKSRDLLQNASGKLKAKRLDLIVANDITATDAGFGTDTNRVTLIDSSGKTEALALASKAEVADILIARLSRLLE